MPLDRDDLEQLSQYALSFRTRQDDLDPFHAYVDRTVIEGSTQLDLADQIPTVNEARAMLTAALAMSHRLHPTAFESFLDLQEMLLVVISAEDHQGPLANVVAANAALSRADQQLRADVRDAHEAGHSWAAIGKALGVSRQAAFERFG